ncbi:hypothetical protein WN943_028814 [Citrus x changshan-huyou]
MPLEPSLTVALSSWLHQRSVCLKHRDHFSLLLM